MFLGVVVSLRVTDAGARAGLRGVRQRGGQRRTRRPPPRSKRGDWAEGQELSLFYSGRVRDRRGMRGFLCGSRYFLLSWGLEWLGQGGKAAGQRERCQAELR